jgi:hypothetical protein
VGRSFTTRSKAVTIRVRSASATGRTAAITVTVRHRPSLSLHRSATTQRHDQTAARITARVGSVSGKHSTGTVTFRDGSRKLKAARTSSTGSASYRLPRSLSVRKHTITATYTPDVASASRVLARTATTHVTVREATSSVTITPAHHVVRDHAKPKARIRVHVAGMPHPTGTVKVYENGHKVRAHALKESERGKITVTLPRTTERGHLRIVARYSGNRSIHSRTSKHVTLRVA